VTVNKIPSSRAIDRELNHKFVAFSRSRKHSKMIDWCLLNVLPREECNRDRLAASASKYRNGATLSLTDWSTKQFGTLRGHACPSSIHIRAIGRVNAVLDVLEFMKAFREKQQTRALHLRLDCLIARSVNYIQTKRYFS